MTGIRTQSNGGGGRGGLECPRRKAPRLVLGLGVSGLAAAIDTHFRNMGWDVARAATGEEAGRLAYRHKATAVVLPVESAAESGLLTCAKLTITRPNARVVLLGPEDHGLARFARYAGAAGYLPTGVGVAAVVKAVLGG
jgi:DNA-binding NarL/FixJ family response regulator